MKVFKVVVYACAAACLLLILALAIDESGVMHYFRRESAHPYRVMRAIAHELTKHQAEHGRFPETLSQLPDDLATKAQEAEIAYRPPLSVNESSTNWVLLLTGVTYEAYAMAWFVDGHWDMIRSPTNGSSVISTRGTPAAYAPAAPGFRSAQP